MINPDHSILISAKKHIINPDYIMPDHITLHVRSDVLRFFFCNI